VHKVTSEALPVSYNRGNKATLVDRLYNHLCSLQPGNADPASAAGSQANNPVIQTANSNNSVGTQSITSVTQTTNSNA